ncbi:unnamed protein product [Caenorhabditis auriculariae]|uniref:Solute carrier organic anion transporter family member n=1 Tax=Caenorhabditis auriculariae TaxID=2777116 RepID=A0A8S1GWN9_9PELO|nr:unnamed protein product [Caenorhabditis auriculariae]
MATSESTDPTAEDAETRSCPGDLCSTDSAQAARFKWSHSRQASQGVPPRRTERPPRRHKETQLPTSRLLLFAPAFEPPSAASFRVKELEEIVVQHHEIIEREMTVLIEESLCGIGKWRPKWLQFLATRGWMLILLCWYCTVQGLIVNGLVPSSISSIERRFKFSTSSMGRIVQFYDFGYVLFCIPVSYFGGRHSKPAVLAAGLALMAFGSLLFSMPHMLSDSYSASQSNTSFGTCSIANMLNNESDVGFISEAMTSSSCKVEQQHQPAPMKYMFLFCLAHFLHGVGATPIFTIGVSYIDENVSPALSSFFVGIFYSFAVFGPALGFLTAGTLLRYHTDFWHLPPEQILKVSSGETDPSWVGAWWLGFIAASFIAALAVFPLLCLPKVLPESLKWHRTRLRDAAMSNRKRTPECCGIPGSNKTAALHNDPPFPVQEQASLLYSSIPARGRGPLWYKIWLDVRHIPIAIYRILTNGLFMIITFAMAVDSLAVTGASSFMSKYLERQFSVASSKANMLIGCVMVPMAGCGCMFAGYVVNKFKLNCVKMLRFAIGLLVLSLLLTPMYMIYCPHDSLIGVDSEYPVGNEKNSYNESSVLAEPTLISSCNAHCTCDEGEYRPVCAELDDGTQITYYSPCFAACAEPYSPTRKEYTECGCVPKNTRGKPRRVRSGQCESKCTGLLGFLILFAPLSFCTFAVAVPVISVILRTVDYNERSFALGIQWILIRVIGTIPAPVLFGWMFDVSCIRYQSSSCGQDGQTGSCLVYSNKLLAHLFMLFSLLGQGVAMGILIFVLCIYGSSLYDDPFGNDVQLQQIDNPEAVGLVEKDYIGKPATKPLVQ